MIVAFLSANQRWIVERSTTIGDSKACGQKYDPRRTGIPARPGAKANLTIHSVRPFVSYKFARDGLERPSYWEASSGRLPN